MGAFAVNYPSYREALAEKICAALTCVAASCFT